MTYELDSAAERVVELADAYAAKCIAAGRVDRDIDERHFIRGWVNELGRRYKDMRARRGAPNFKRLRLRPGDVLLIESDRPMRPDVLEAVRQQVKQSLPDDVRVMVVMEPGLHLRQLGNDRGTL